MRLDRQLSSTGSYILKLFLDFLKIFFRFYYLGIGYLVKSFSSVSVLSVFMLIDSESALGVLF